MTFLIWAIVDIVLRVRVPKFNRALRRAFIAFEVRPFESNEFQAHVVAMGNRVLLRSGDYACFSHIELALFVASSFQCKVLS